MAYYGHASSQYMAIVKELGKVHGFSLETPFKELTEEQKEILFHGTGNTVWKTDWVFKTKTREGTQALSMNMGGTISVPKTGILQDPKE